MGIYLQFRRLVLLFLLLFAGIAAAQTTTVTVTSLTTDIGTCCAFGNWTVGAPTNDLIVEVTNTGSFNWYALAVSITGTNAADFGEYDSCNAPNRTFIPPNKGFCDIHIWFKPSTAASETATLNIVGNDSGSPHTVSLSGTGINPLHTYYVDPRGSDSNTCTGSGPGSSCKTPQHVYSLMVPGDMACFAGGQRFSFPALGVGTWTITSGGSGSPSVLPMVFSACGTSPSPVLSGSPLPTSLNGLFTASAAGGGLCNGDTNCKDYTYSSSSFTLFDDLWYGPQGAPLGTITRRREPISNNKNNTSNVGDSNVCKAGPSSCSGGSNAQQCANIACGAPAAGLIGANGTANSPAAGQQSPCSGGTPWYCGNLFEYRAGGAVGTSPHAAAIGAIKVKPVAIWTMETSVICFPGNTTASGQGYSCPAPTSNTGAGVASLVGPGSVADGSNGGFIPGHEFLIINRMEDAQRGQWYLDQCPGCPSNTGTPAGTQTLHILADLTQSENPNVDNILYSQITGPTGHLLNISGCNYCVFDGLTLDVPGNYMVFPWGNQEDQGQPTVSADVTIANSSHFVWHNMIEQHCTGKCIEFQNMDGWTDFDGAAYDCGAGCKFIGHIGTTSDTNTTVPRFGTIMNDLVQDGGRQYPSGEATCFAVANGHDITVLHVDSFRCYAGQFNLGNFLNLGVAGSQNAGYIYNNKFLWIHGFGMLSLNSTPVGLTNGYCCADYGILYSAANHSSMANTPGDTQPIDIQHYNNWIIGAWLHDCASNYNAQDHQCDARYSDQGTSQLFTYQLLAYRATQDCAYINLGSHGTGNAAAQWAYQYNLIDNSIFGFCGSQEMTSNSNFPVSGTGSRLIISGGAMNTHRWTIQHSIGIFNSANQVTPQALPGNFQGVDYSQLAIISGGSGYGTQTFAVTFSGGGCTTEPAAEATSVAGVVVATHLTLSGSNCSSAPTPNFSAGGGTGASVTVSTGTGQAACGTGAAGLCVIPGPAVAVSDTCTVFCFLSDAWWDINQESVIFGYCPYSILVNQTPSTSCRSFPADYNTFVVPPFPWQGTNGTNNYVADPAITCPLYGGCGATPESWMPTNTVLMNLIGFTPWDYTASGRINPVIFPATAPNMYPTLNTNPSTDYTCLDYDFVNQVCLDNYNPVPNSFQLGGTWEGGTRK